MHSIAAASSGNGIGIWAYLAVFAATAFVLSVGPAAYGAGKVSTGHHDSVSLGMLIAGLAIGAVCMLLAMRTAGIRLASPPQARRPGRPRRQPTGRDPLLTTSR